jgi:hypothetical protein
LIHRGVRDEGVVVSRQLVAGIGWLAGAHGPTKKSSSHFLDAGAPIR